MNQRRDIVFSGRVQGVGFRATTASLARRFAVRGFVRNLPDGDVELAVEGADTEINAFISELRSVFQSHIRGCRETTKPAQGEFADFNVRY